MILTIFVFYDEYQSREKNTTCANLNIKYSLLINTLLQNYFVTSILQFL